MIKIWFLGVLWIINGRALGLSIEKVKPLDEWKFEINYELEYIFEQAEWLEEKEHVKHVMHAFFSSVENDDFRYFDLVRKRQKIFSQLKNNQCLSSSMPNRLIDIDGYFNNYTEHVKSGLNARYSLVDGVDELLILYLKDELERIIEYMDTSQKEDENIGNAIETLIVLASQMNIKGLTGYFEFTELFWKVIHKIEINDTITRQVVKVHRDKLFNKMENYFYNFENQYIASKDSPIFAPVE